MAINKIRAGGRVTVPKEVLDAGSIRPGDTAIVRAVAEGTIELRVVPRLTLAETFERYRIEEPVDWPADRNRWESEAADEVLKEAGMASPVSATPAPPAVTR